MNREQVVADVGDGRPIVHAIDRRTGAHLCGALSGFGTDALAPATRVTCPECRNARPQRPEGDCWLCTHAVWGPLCASCGCLAHYPPYEPPAQTTAALTGDAS